MVIEQKIQDFDVSAVAKVAPKIFGKDYTPHLVAQAAYECIEHTGSRIVAVYGSKTRILDRAADEFAEYGEIIDFDEDQQRFEQIMHRAEAADEPVFVIIDLHEVPVGYSEHNFRFAATYQLGCEPWLKQVLHQVHTVAIQRYGVTVDLESADVEGDKPLAWDGGEYFPPAHPIKRFHRVSSRIISARTRHGDDAIHQFSQSGWPQNIEYYQDKMDQARTTLDGLGWPATSEVVQMVDNGAELPSQVDALVSCLLIYGAIVEQITQAQQQRQGQDVHPVPDTV